MGDIGHRCDVELDCGDAFLRQAVAGAFDHGVVAAGLNHLGEKTLHVRRIGRRDVQAGIALLPAQTCAPTVVITPTRPAGSAAVRVATAKMESIKVLVVVLPSVPVTPMTVRLWLGKPCSAAQACARAKRLSATSM